MAGKRPGPLCSFDLGIDWIDGGTPCLSRSVSGGPLCTSGVHPPIGASATSSGPHGVRRFLLSAVLGAAPEAARSDPNAAARGMFAYDIDLVAGSPFGSTAEGKRIVEVLRQLNAKGRIVYGGNLDGSRGDWDGTTIRVDQRFSGKVVGSTVEMVHEATHALWRKAPSEMKDATARWQATVDDEVRAQENQLTVYRYLTVEKSLPRDTELEWRLEQQAAGTLRKMVEMQFLDSKPK